MKLLILVSFFSVFPNLIGQLHEDLEFISFVRRVNSDTSFLYYEDSVYVTKEKTYIKGVIDFHGERSVLRVFKNDSNSKYYRFNNNGELLRYYSLVKNVKNGWDFEKQKDNLYSYTYFLNGKRNGFSFLKEGDKYIEIINLSIHKHTTT